ncbi:MAG: NAD-dependent epimerase/dehydratase family protein [Acidimicrobiia bacterium]|nr:NAD-dependent epimerase/dehydratase family protein [Acidimicrobiia bacterium]
MRALVTGSSGFIGGHLVRELRRRGTEVIGIDRRATPDSSWEHRIDLSDRSNHCRIADLAETSDVVFHLAARPGVRDTSPDIRMRRHHDNVLATTVLLDGVPLQTPVVVTSSSSVYGSAMVEGDLKACQEDDPLRPLGGYARSKVMTEELCWRRAAEGGRIAVARPFTVAGEGQRPDMAFSTWIDAIAMGAPIRLFGSPNRVRDVTDVDHVVNGLIAMSERSFGGTVNLGTGKCHRIIDMARTVIECMGRPTRIEVVDGGGEEVDGTLADTTRCERVLGFVPSTDLEALVERMVGALSSSDRVGVL